MGNAALEILDTYQNTGRFHHCISVYVDLYGLSLLCIIASI
jgi:hypothetical protein